MLTDTPVREAELKNTDRGRVPTGEGWYIVNAADAWAIHSEDYGPAVIFEGPDARFPNFGINVQVLEPGKPTCMYHRETGQECMLMLEGEAKVIVEGEERTMKKGDFFYCAPGTAHVFVGTSDQPASVLMVGMRDDNDELLYPPDETAAKYGASTDSPTPDAKVAYAHCKPIEHRPLGKVPW